MLTALAIEGYRSLRKLKLPLEAISVVTGLNGAGKSSLYRSLKLLADVAQGRIVQSVAAEGGLSSILWAGPEAISRSMRSGEHPVQGTVRTGPVSLKLGFASEDYGFAIDLGLPSPSQSMFGNDPEIKPESLWIGQALARTNAIANRKGPSVQIRDREGNWEQAHSELGGVDSMMTHCANNRDAFELLHLRERMRGWRFYDHLRTDKEAPARRPQIATFTPVLAGDGNDLASAIQTVFEIGDGGGFDDTISDAFPGASVEVEANVDGFVGVRMRQHGLLRPLDASELSDGTLRYLLLAAALFTLRPPELIVLNEPETSLHPDLLSPLARLMARVAGRSQLIIVSHASALANAICEETGAIRIELQKDFGETIASGLSEPDWTWPSR